MLSVDEAARRSAVAWVDVGHGPRLVWHLWHDGALWLVCGGLEQELPGAGTADLADVVLRDKATGHTVTWLAEVTLVEAGTEAWASVVPLLHEKRLNPPDGEAQPERWARESLVLRLTPRTD